MRSRLDRVCAGLLLWSASLAAVCGATGCQLNRSFFQIDSDSRSPFFGVDLTPRWPTSAAATDQADPSESEPTPTRSVKTEIAAADVPEPRPLALPFADAPSSASLADAAPIEQFR